MKKYTHSAYNYVSIVEINKSEIDFIDFASCKEPRETLGSYYNRQSRKPDVLINGGFFALANGTPVFNFVDNEVIKSSNADYKVGMGVAKDKTNELIFGYLTNKSIKWKDFISAYPVLLDKTGPKTSFSCGSEINYRALRSCIGFNENTIFVIHIGKPGMTFQEMSYMLYYLGVDYAINLDGGGSARLLVNGLVYGEVIENRSVNNVIAFYLKTSEIENSSSENSSIAASNSPYVLYTVKSGDSWWGISQSQLGDGSKYKELIYFNRLTEDNAKLFPGMQVRIPSNSIKYTVQPGDSWWSIAAKKLGSGFRYEELAKYNNKSSNSVLISGDVINIPV